MKQKKLIPAQGWTVSLPSCTPNIHVALHPLCSAPFLQTSFKEENTQTAIQEILFNIQILLFLGGPACLLRLCRFHPWTYSKANQAWSWAPCSGYPCLSWSPGAPVSTIHCVGSCFIVSLSDNVCNQHEFYLVLAISNLWSGFRSVLHPPVNCPSMASHCPPGRGENRVGTKTHGDVPPANAKNRGGKFRHGGFAAVAAALPALPGLALFAFIWISSWTKGTGFFPWHVYILV